MKRFFENAVRKKRIPVFYLEWICSTVATFVWLLLALLGLLILDHYISGHIYRRSPGGCGLMLIAIYIFMQINWIVVTYNLFSAHSFKKNNAENNCLIVDIGNRCIPAFNGYSTFLYFLMKEPYIYRVWVLTDSYCNDGCFGDYERLHLNYPIHKSYKKEPDYGKYLKQYEEDERKTDPWKKNSRLSNYKYRKKLKGNDWHRYNYYITYEKAQALNKVFELVDPPVFRIVVNEYQKRLISIHPIEGREYPPEVPELLEKINQMYP